MCRICQPILGPYTKHHTETECSLVKASYCSRCGTRGHFKEQCSFKAKRTPFAQQVIPSTNAEVAPKYYALANTNEAYVEYCRLFTLPIQGTLELNKQTVVQHLEGRGYSLEPPPQLPPQPSKRRLMLKKSA